MKGVKEMTKYREILRLKNLDFSDRNIAISCVVSRNTVAKVIKKAAEYNLVWPLPDDLTDEKLGLMLFPKEQTATNKRMPDYSHVRKELLRNGVTKKLLWIEYCEDCRMGGEEPLMYSQFCYYIQQDEQKRRATMHIPRKPGEQVEVDWAGDPAYIIDADTGEVTDAHIFVGVMTYSQYTYVEAFINEQQRAWLTAHVNMYDYFGGVAKILVSDNCATAVNIKKRNWYTPELNKSYYALAEHYNTAIIPTRVRKPKDKPNVEGSVNLVSMWITAALRDEQFFSLSELNSAIMEKLKTLNSNEFQKKEGSRLSVFLGEEKPLLAALPATRFELADWRQPTVQFNYHIAVDKMYYSVPFHYIRNDVDVRVTETMIEVFYHQNRIASHRRLYGRPGQYSTFDEHMPEEHRKYLEWNGDRFRKWAEKIGDNTHAVIDGLLTSGRVEQQSYRSCMGLLKLAEKHSPEKLEEACKKALVFSNSPSYKSIKNIMVTMKDIPAIEPQEVTKNNHHGITRGAKYYRGDRHD